MADIIIPTVLTGKKIPIPQVARPAIPPVKPVGLGGASSGAQLLEDIPAGPTYPGYVYQEAAANLKGNPEAAAQTMKTRLGGEEAARYGRNIARLGMRGVGGALGAEQVGAAAAGDPTAVPGAAIGGAMLAGAGGAAALGGLASALYPTQVATQAQENAEIARLSERKFGEAVAPNQAAAPQVETAKPGWWESVFGGKEAPATVPSKDMPLPGQVWQAPIGEFNGRPITRGQAQELAARLPTAGSATSPNTGQTFNLSPFGGDQNLPSSRGEAIMNAARSGAIRPDEALRMYEGQPAREATAGGLPSVLGQPQESAWARETRESNAMRDLWGDHSGFSSGTGYKRETPQEKAARLQEHAANPLYQAPTTAKEDLADQRYAQQQALATLNEQGRSALEDKRFAHQQAIEDQRALAQGARASGQVQEKAEAKQAEEEQKADADVIGVFKTNPAQAQVLLSQLKAQVGGPAARAIMQQIPSTATAEEMRAFVSKAIGGA